jgi:predicted enzyme related to lactoylglutathione lyase
MFKDSDAFNSFSVDDLDAAKAFYGEVLGLAVTDQSQEGMPLLSVALGGGGSTMIYPKDDHAPAGFTLLNFPVDDIDAAVDALVEKGVRFEHYEGFDQDEKGIARGQGSIAWFTDPAGNVLSVLSM